MGAAEDSGEWGEIEDLRTRRTEREAQLNLGTMLQLCGAGGLRCSERTGRASAASVAELGSRLADGDFYPDDPIAAFAWPLLVQAGGLARVETGRLRLTPKGRAACSLTPAEVIRGLWRRWPAHAVIDELSRVEEIKGQRAANVLTAARPRRQAVADALARCPAGEWVDVDELFACMQAWNLSPTIARSERAVWKLYLVDAEHGSLGWDGFHDWELLEGRYTLAVLFEYAATLGLVDLAYGEPAGARDDFRSNWGSDDMDALSRYDGLQAIRVNALGAYVLGLAEGYDPPATPPTASGSLKVLPDLRVVAVGDVGEGETLLLSAFAERTADRVWTLSAAGLLGALDAGRDLREFTGFLTERAEHELPDTLRALVKDVTRRAGQLTDLGYLRVIECADAAVAARITQDRRLSGLCRPVGDRHVAVAAADEPRFRRALLKVGQVLPPGGG